MHVTVNRDFDYILAGGGLQAGLLALAIRHHQPTATILVVERGENFGGNHTWSFHRGDIPTAAEQWMTQVPIYDWDSYFVRFPGYEAVIDLQYASTTSQRLGEAVVHRLQGDSSHACRLMLNVEVTDVQLRSITTAAGEQFTARCVIDCRGHRSRPISEEGKSLQFPRCGYQKFFGAEIELEEDWPHAVPTLMDACVDQADGFHFVYVLPFSRRKVLVEDTWFSDNPSIDFDASAKHLRRYIGKQTHSSWNAIRFERGCLPMPIHGLMPQSVPQSAAATLAGGYAGGWFHAATGYSFPLAAKFANAVASVVPEQARVAVEDLRVQHYSRFRFSRTLNRLLFQLVQPNSRWQIFRRLYRSLPPQRLARFYAHEFSAADAVRMVVGMPPLGLTPLKFIRGIRPNSGASKSLLLETSP